MTLKEHFSAYDNRVLTNKPLVWMAKLHILLPVTLVATPVLFLMGIFTVSPFNIYTETLYIIANVIAFLLNMFYIWWQYQSVMKSLLLRQAKKLARYCAISYLFVIVVCNAFVIGYHINFSMLFDHERFQAETLAYYQDLAATINDNQIHNGQIINESLGMMEDELKIDRYRSLSDSLYKLIAVPELYDIYSTEMEEEYVDTTAVAVDATVVSLDSTVVSEEDTVSHKRSMQDVIYKFKYLNLKQAKAFASGFEKVYGRIADFDRKHFIPLRGKMFDKADFNRQLVDSLMTVAVNDKIDINLFMERYDMPYKTKEGILKIGDVKYKYIDSRYLYKNQKRIEIIIDVTGERNDIFTIICFLTALVLIVSLMLSQVLLTSINAVEAVLSPFISLGVAGLVILGVSYIKNIIERRDWLYEHLSQIILISIGIFIATGIYFTFFRRAEAHAYTFFRQLMIHMTYFSMPFLVTFIIAFLDYSYFRAIIDDTDRRDVAEIAIGLLLFFFGHHIFIKRLNYLYHLPRN